ncbi:hypothetical protein [Dictyobacter halimunensis]|uniref:hypothetical protein n=1 Tax=Dictyobacter halimunensis TaxID=3026934 RepID=UPI0030C6B348
MSHTSKHFYTSASLPSCTTISKIIGSILLLSLFVLSACASGPANTPHQTQTGSQTATSQTLSDKAGEINTVMQVSSQNMTTNGYMIKVYFSKFPNSLNSSTAVFPVNRISPTIAVATFSLQLLIAGPTNDEHNAGYFSEFNSILTGPSSCSAPHPTGGPDFTLTLNKQGSKAKQGTATVKFCRATASPGIGTDTRILAEIKATLTQFSNIKNVVVLTKDGHCFGDESGLDHCLQ